MPGVAYKRPSGTVGFAEEVGQIRGAIESLLLSSAANPRLQCGYPFQNTHKTGRNVPPDSRELRDFPSDEDCRQSIVGGMRENQIAIAQVHLEAVDAGAAPIGEVPAGERRNFLIHRRTDGSR